MECQSGSGQYRTINEVVYQLRRRLTRIFLRGADGRRRPVFRQHEKIATDPHRDHVLLYEYFDGDNGRGVGASHRTGWTGLVAKLLQPRQSDRL